MTSHPLVKYRWTQTVFRWKLVIPFSPCCVLANVKGQEICNGASGAAIGGSNDDASEKAAEELARLIVDAKPTDYDWEGVYSDIPVNIKMGVKNGKPYYKEYR